MAVSCSIEVLTGSGVGLNYDAAGDVQADNMNRYLYDAEGRLCAVQSLWMGTTQYEAKVSEWLSDMITRQPFDKCESLNDVLAEGEIAMLKMLYDSEFKDPLLQAENVQAPLAIAIRTPKRK